MILSSIKQLGKDVNQLREDIELIDGVRYGEFNTNEYLTGDISSVFFW